MHQGWLLKKGGLQKRWLKRYFVLYRTCMGHILCYYSDYTETALYADAAKVHTYTPTHTVAIACTFLVNQHREAQKGLDRTLAVA
jgi:hypothetical protein